MRHRPALAGVAMPEGARVREMLRRGQIDPDQARAAETWRGDFLQADVRSCATAPGRGDGGRQGDSLAGFSARRCREVREWVERQHGRAGYDVLVRVVVHDDWPAVAVEPLGWGRRSANDLLQGCLGILVDYYVHGRPSPVPTSGVNRRQPVPGG